MEKMLIAIDSSDCSLRAALDCYLLSQPHSTGRCPLYLRVSFWEDL